MLVRLLYSLLFYIAMPFILLRLLWRSRRLPSYRERLGERLGYYQSHLSHGCIWIHAVSVGEVLAAVPLIKALQGRYPEHPVLVTTMTPTGYQRVKTAFGNEVSHCYIPYDFPGAVKRFLDTACPKVAIIMETELWPNLLHGCHVRQIPICLMNARLSEKSAIGYARIASLAHSMLQHITVIAAHGEKDKNRLIHLGANADRVVMTGNIKFDLTLPADLPHRIVSLRESLGRNRFVWIAASTHEGEEAMILQAHQKICEKDRHALLILVPRHPDRFDRVAALCEEKFSTKRRSKQETIEEANVYLGDTMGELLLLYGASDVAFVGGSLIPQGGHNMLEPAALGKPILTGPYLHNFAEISDLFLQASALSKMQDSEALARELIELMDNAKKRHEMGDRALQVMAENRGALKSQLDLLTPVIDLKLKTI